MGRPSLPLKGQARSWGRTTGAAFRTSALWRFTLLELFEADRTNGGRVPIISRSADACLPGCLKRESVMDAARSRRA